MPFYEYEIIRPDGQPGDRFEVQQRMDDPPLTRHPETNAPVRRVISAPTLPGKFSDHAANRVLKDDKRLDQLGFTKYVRSGQGTYEKRAGQGPRTISADD
jgi:predicted nucleic acid-binding Zn ribbon protein